MERRVKYKSSISADQMKDIRVVIKENNAFLKMRVGSDLCPRYFEYRLDPSLVRKLRKQLRGAEFQLLGGIK